MKKSVTIIALFTVIAICMAIVFRNLVSSDDDGYRSARERAVIKKFDKDGDGELNREERKAIREASDARKKAYLEKFDKDGDGELNKEERQAAGKAKAKAKISDR